MDTRYFCEDDDATAAVWSATQYKHPAPSTQHEATDHRSGTRSDTAPAAVGASLLVMQKNVGEYIHDVVRYVRYIHSSGATMYHTRTAVPVQYVQISLHVLDSTTVRVL